jgi:hypothetical protein
MSSYRKYTGGSKVVSFRLPIKGYKEAMARVNALLDTIARESNDKPANATKPEEARDNTVLNKEDTSLTYQCGCTTNNILFRRASGCSLARVDHRN